MTKVIKAINKHFDLMKPLAFDAIVATFCEYKMFAANRPIDCRIDAAALSILSEMERINLACGIDILLLLQNIKCNTHVRLIDSTLRGAHNETINLSESIYQSFKSINRPMQFFHFLVH